MKTGCILVLYNPDRDLLEKVVGSIAGQVEKVFVADNSPMPVELFRQVTNVVYRHMGGNVGIAAAQNEGLKYFLERDFDFIFFLDQDSIVAPDMVARLYATYRLLIDKEVKVGAVGPRAVNRKTEKKYSGSYLSSIGKGRKYMPDITEVSELISSASFIPTDAFRESGLMESSLFIDHVDYEWCWRAHVCGGNRFFVDETNTFSHQLGEGNRKILFHNISIPTPMRTYYQYRNYLWLLCRPYVSLRWKLTNAPKYLVKLFYYPICVSPRKKYLKNMLRGIKDGIITKPVK